METEIKDLLKQHYSSKQTSELFRLLDEATTKLLSYRISNCALSRAIREGFPDSVSKKVREKRQTYIYGLEKNNNKKKATNKQIKTASSFD